MRKMRLKKKVRVKMKRTMKLKEHSEKVRVKDEGNIEIEEKVRVKMKRTMKLKEDSEKVRVKDEGNDQIDVGRKIESDQIRGDAKPDQADDPQPTFDFDKADLGKLKKR